jgi:signal peptidase I
MEFDFALLLVLATAVCGLIWGYDKLLLAPKRRIALAQAQGQSESLPADAANRLNEEPSWVETGRSMFPVLLVVLVLRSFLVEPFQIPSGSMLPTLQIGDFILVNKFEYGIRLPVTNSKVVELGAPQRGDVVVFRYPKKPSVNYIKRVVGLPGDRIAYVNKTLYINGEAQPQTLLAQLPPSRPQQLLIDENLSGVQHQIYRDVNRMGVVGEWVVPEGNYFMVGDNRDNSNDSRYWGFVPDELIVGKAFAVWMHWPELFSIPDFGDARLIK